MMSRYRRSRRSNGRRLESVSHRCSSTIIAALGDHLLSHLLIIITEVVNERRVCCATLFPQKLKTCAAACVGKRPEDSGHVSRKECGRCDMVSEVGGGQVVCTCPLRKMSITTLEPTSPLIRAAAWSMLTLSMFTLSIATITSAQRQMQRQTLRSHQAPTVDSKRAAIGSPTTRMNCARVKPYHRNRDDMFIALARITTLPGCSCGFKPNRMPIPA